VLSIAVPSTSTTPMEELLFSDGLMMVMEGRIASAEAKTELLCE
jgi:hypothetical protein